jgi:signal peptide peptidase SppA
VDYSRYISRVTSQPWALLPEKLSVIQTLITERASGYRPTPEEIRARLEGSERAPRPTSGGRTIAVLPVHGVVVHRGHSFEASSGGTSIEWLAQNLRALVDRPDVDTIVLDVDSPGGSTDGLVAFADELYRARKSKRLIAVANSMAASAAFWLASQANELVIEPSGSVGSVGVYALHIDETGHLEKEGIRVTAIKAGARKLEGAPWEALSEDTKRHLQSTVDELYASFVGAVSRGRRTTFDKVESQFGQGRMYQAAEAVRRGMADRVATLHQVLEELAGGRSSSRSRSSSSAGPAGVDQARALAARFDAELQRMDSAAVGALQARALKIQLELELQALGRQEATYARFASFVFEGTAVPYGQKRGDRHDVVERGAFDEYLRSGRVPLVLVDHGRKDRTPIAGRFEYLDSTPEGLVFAFRPLDTSRARALRDRAEAEGGLGVSMGPSRVESRSGGRGERAANVLSIEGHTIITRASLAEISLLTERGPAYNGASCSVVRDGSRAWR